MSDDKSGGFDGLNSWDDMDVQRGDAPIDPLTELCAQMTSVLDEPENEGVKAIVFLTKDTRSGIQLAGYEETSEAMADLFIHMKAMFQSMGKDLHFMGIPDFPDVPGGTEF
jgi:hypothetical protein